jgi:putative transposase
MLLGSMGRVGACGDNAAMESSFSAAKSLDRQRWTTRKELRLAIITWIELTYHRRRSASGAALRRAQPGRRRRRGQGASL